MAANVEDALINVAEVFYTGITLIEKLQMDIYEYCTLCRATYYFEPF